jgi:hypothetical protein
MWQDSSETAGTPKGHTVAPVQDALGHIPALPPCDARLITTLMQDSSGLTPEQVKEYLYRSYTRVDGLWFVMTEERLGFDTALALDEAVWKVVPKIQARLLQEQLGLPRDLAGLARALRAKLDLDRYEFALDEAPAALNVTLSRCPWHDLMERSGRAHLSERIGGVICGVELPVFAQEFNCACAGAPQERLCRNGAACKFRFEP